MGSHASLRWSCKSNGQLARELTRQGHSISADTPGRLLKAEKYGFQTNRKRFEGKQHPDRNAQFFEHIATSVEAFQGRDSPVISVDTNKKELVGNYLNRGSCPVATVSLSFGFLWFCDQVLIFL